MNYNVARNLRRTVFLLSVLRPQSTFLSLAHSFSLRPKMVERIYMVEGKQIRVNLYVEKDVVPTLVVEIETNGMLNKYIDGDKIMFGLKVEDVLDALLQAMRG